MGWDWFDIDTHFGEDVPRQGLYLNFGVEAKVWVPSDEAFGLVDVEPSLGDFEVGGGLPFGEKG